MIITMPQIQRRAPTMRNSYFQGPGTPLIWPMPYPKTPPMATPNPFAVYSVPSSSPEVYCNPHAAFGRSPVPR